MNDKTIEADEQIERLDAEYRGAFDEWAVQVSRLQEVRESVPGGVGAKEAADRVAAAENAYRKLRDRLAENISGKTDN